MLVGQGKNRKGIGAINTMPPHEKCLLWSSCRFVSIILPSLFLSLLPFILVGNLH